MRAFKNFSIQVAISALWPSYLALMALAARVGPWSRELARPASFVLWVLALALFLAALARFLFGPRGWAEDTLKAPPPAARQIRRACWSLAIGMIVFLLPSWLLNRGLIAHGDRPVTAPAVSRFLVLGFEVLIGIVALRVLRPRSSFMTWIGGGETGGNALGRHRRVAALLVLVLIGAIITLDSLGYSYTARRVSTAILQAVGLASACWLLHRLIVRAIDGHAWRWMKPGASGGGAVAPGDHVSADDTAGRLKRLSAWVIPLLGLGIGAWYWNFDGALVRALADRSIVPGSAYALTVGDAFKAVVIFTLTGVAWRHLGAFFSLVVFPRMADDPGIRFAVLTLCRYLVLGAGLILGMTALHFGLDRIGVGLAALGVGLGFGLQEIVSNFVSGIILLLERPIRVGDIVTVAGMSGKVERINIRATTIINADNQSLIVPNREFITANLVNWTHKDRVLRISIPVGVGYGSDPDNVAELLLAIARADADVLRNPVPTAIMEGFGDSALNFTLHAHVPDPSLAGRVKHRLCAEIQRRFKAQGISIPMPSREILVKSAGHDHDHNHEQAAGGRQLGPFWRADGPATVPPPPTPSRCPVCFPEPAEPLHRGVDE